MGYVNTTLYTEKNIETEQNTTYTKTIPLVNINSSGVIEEFKIEININDNFITLTQNELYNLSDGDTISGILEIDDGNIDYSITMEINENNENSSANLILTYEFKSVEKTRINNKLVLKKDDEEQSINLPISSIIGTENINYSANYHLNPDLSNLSVGGTYYEVEYSTSIDENSTNGSEYEQPYGPYEPIVS